MKNDNNFPENYVDYDDLDFDYENHLEILDGKPFSGVAYEKRPDGGLEETMIVFGLKNGMAKAWYPSGNAKSEEHYLANSIHGMRWVWFDSGQLRAEEIYEYGMKTKSWIYNEDGELIKKYDYREENPEDLKFLKLIRQKRRTNFGR